MTEKTIKKTARKSPNYLDQPNVKKFFNEFPEALKRSEFVRQYLLQNYQVADGTHGYYNKIKRPEYHFDTGFYYWVNQASVVVRFGFRENTEVHGGFTKVKYQGRRKPSDSNGEICTNYFVDIKISNKTDLATLGDFLSQNPGSRLVKRLDVEMPSEITADSISHKNPHIEDIYSLIKRRQGQPMFRKALLEAFENKCAITGCKFEKILEAAHIIPHNQKVNYETHNGLLLRADIHTLFDLNLIKINGAGEVEWDEGLAQDATYKKLIGNKKIKLPKLPKKEIDVMYSLLKQRYEME